MKQFKFCPRFEPKRGLSRSSKVGNLIACLQGSSHLASTYQNLTWLRGQKMAITILIDLFSVINLPYLLQT
ncbi:MAG: hypothetical protein BGO43_12400 [Gammaproteobacteria bacterium 39-13]|nr:MAG: hypothetical protein BGO43_12400 [Gammaproteobacteria bacterium 39-13]